MIILCLFRCWTIKKEICYSCLSKVVCDYITERKGAKFLGFLHQNNKKKLYILKQYLVWFAIKSPTLSILSFSSCKFSSALQSNKLFFMSGKKQATIFFLQSYTNHRLGHSSWQPFTKLQSTSLATEQTIWWTTNKKGAIYQRVLAKMSNKRMLLRAYRNNFGWYIEGANYEYVYITSLTSK